MKYPQDGFTASIQPNLESEKEFWVYAIRLSGSGEMLYHGFSNDALEAVPRIFQ